MMRVTRCPTCEQGDTHVTGMRLPDPAPLAVEAADYRAAPGEVVPRVRSTLSYEVPEVTSYVLRCGHEVDAREWDLAPLYRDPRRGANVWSWVRRGEETKDVAVGTNPVASL